MNQFCKAASTVFSSFFSSVLPTQQDETCSTARLRVSRKARKRNTALFFFLILVWFFFLFLTAPNREQKQGKKKKKSKLSWNYFENTFFLCWIYSKRIETEQVRQPSFLLFFLSGLTYAKQVAQLDLTLKVTESKYTWRRERKTTTQKRVETILGI